MARLTKTLWVVFFSIYINSISMVILFSQGKNLVPNFSFEKYEKCPDDYTPQDMSHKLVPYWSYPTIATPDYFNRCSPHNVSVPSNFAGERHPLPGEPFV